MKMPIVVLFRYIVYMFGIRYQWIKIFFLTAIVCLSFSFTKTFAFSASSLNGLLTSVPHNEEENLQIKRLLSSYCSAVLTSPSFIENGFVYDAKQSAFVHLLCKNIGIPSPYFTDKENYFTRSSFAELWFQDISSQHIDLCTPSSFSNDCNLAIYIPKLFNDIMNDYVNMKQVHLYGLSANFKNDADIVQQINTFTSGYFAGIQVCETTPRSYPKTCSMMKWYIKNVRNTLSEVRIFNASGILADDATCVLSRTGDIFYCGLYGNTPTKMNSFVNLGYNELLYYRLFMWYYLAMVQKYPWLLKRNIYMTNYTTILKTFSTQYMWSKDALSLSFRMMSDSYMAFPFHIGFSMYQEDLDGLWKSLARLAPPIYTLYDKLRNVQSPQ